MLLVQVNACRDKRREFDTYPLSTPRTRLSTKNEPMMIMLTKYIQGQLFPIASFIWKQQRQNYHSCQKYM